MIYTVTCNPTLDKTWSVPELRPGEFHRAQVISEDISGKGINVSLALQALGIKSKTLGFVGGRTGQAFQEGLTARGLDLDFIWVDGETRQNITLLDESNGVYTKINEPGPTVTPAQLAALQAQVEQFTQPGDFWIFSGSLPPGAPVDLYADLIRRAQARGGKAFLDTSGAALRAGIEARPFCIKPNSDEASEYFNTPLLSDDDHARAVRRFLSIDGVQIAAITRGEQGLVFGMNPLDEIYIAVPPPVEARSTVGAGDSALTGILWGLLDGCAPEMIARRGAAFGTATAMQDGSKVGNRALIESLIPRIDVQAVVV